MEGLESALAAWFRKACESNTPIEGTHLKEKVLHVAAHLEIANFSASSGWMADLRRDKILFTELLSSGSRNVNPQNVEDWKNY
jgi:hypothetical protein